MIKDNIHEGTIIISASWKAYNCLQEEGLQAPYSDHSFNFVDTTTGVHTDKIERRWRDLKQSVPKYERRKAHFIGYLAIAYFMIHHSDPST